MSSRRVSAVEMNDKHLKGGKGAGMPEYLSPGVYVEEIEICAKPIEKVSTSTAGFLGTTERGPERTLLVTEFVDIPGTLHNVMIQGIEGNNIFRDEEDRKDFPDRINSLVKETGTRILALALMDGIPMVEIARLVGVGITGAAIAIKRIEAKTINSE
jgi:phage tail sheath protein FI